MTLSIDKFIRLRPFLYHLTDRGNLTAILGSRELVSAATLLEKCDRGDQVRVRRHQHAAISDGGGRYLLRDQQPLHRGPMQLEQGWEYDDFVELVNGLVFFWPGNSKGPIEHGRRHFRRYEQERPVVLRVDSGAMLRHDENEALFCRFNSGAPRCSRGRYAPRGGSTFQSAESIQCTPSKVIEVVFRARAILPEAVEVGVLSADDEWAPIRM